MIIVVGNGVFGRGGAVLGFGQSLSTQGRHRGKCQ